MYTNIDPNHFYARKLFLERNTFSLNKAMVIILDGTYAHVAIVWKKTYMKITSKICHYM